MKKLLLFAFGAMMATPLLAQEEDVTNLIQNAGFDEDLTFQADGSMKEIVSTTTSLSDRSWAYVAADNTVYAKPKESSSQQRKDGRSKLDAVNGFKGQVQGWTLESNAEFPKCEWTYFGTVPYDLDPQAVPVADDGDTYLLVPERPTEFDGGTGFVYLRAGWTNSAIYKQVVKLPCAQYRLEYWTININPNTSSVAEDLTMITCRKDVFKDEEGTGLQAQVWTKHEFEFTPTAEFTMQFGYKAANAGSGGQPIVALDGIKLYKIGEADKAELLSSDLTDLQIELHTLADEAAAVGLSGLAAEIYDAGLTLDDVIGGDDVDELQAAFDSATKQFELYKQAIAAAADLDAAIAKMERLANTTDYPGKDDFTTALNRIRGYKANGTAQQIIGAPEEAQAAILDYVKSQSASQNNPADFTALVSNPWFVGAEFEPTGEDGNYAVPEEAGDNINSTGWYRGSNTGGDQNAKICQTLPCWNAWNTNFSEISISQDLSGLPNGYYQVSALLITQQDYANQTQHVFAKNDLGTFKSPMLQVGNWDSSDNATGTGEWIRLTTEMALVTDGKLTIGAAGEGKGATNQSGWFCATGFKLYYLGDAGENAVQEMLNAKKDEAQSFAYTMHLAADKAALLEAINATGEAVEVLKALSAAYEEAQNSEAKYEEYMEEGKTLPTVQATLAGEGYDAATEIVKFAYDYTMAWINGSEATYKQLDSQVNLLKNYLNTYAPVYNEAAELADKSSDAAKTSIEAVMQKQKDQLIADMQTYETVKEFVDELQAVMANAQKQIIWETAGATDYTAFILNPMLASEAGWTFEKGNGNNNTGGGQWYNGDTSIRYIDSYNGEGLKGYKAMQVVTGLPNGTYDLGVYTRSPAEGAYVFYAATADTTYVEIPLNYYTDDEGAEQVASDTHGPIWDAAVEAYNNGSTDDEVLAIYNANDGKGRGWKHQVIEAIAVNNHTLCIRALAGSIEDHKTEKDFAGSWFSAGGWTLTLVAAGNNEGWEGPLADGIETITADMKNCDGIYTLNGLKLAKMQRGLNIIVNNGKAMKVMVK